MLNKIKQQFIGGVVVLIVLCWSTSLVISKYPITVETPTTSLKYIDVIYYVGGAGPDNYSTIQDAINIADEGDIIFVYNGTYHEHININKELRVYGEDANMTIIDGSITETVVSITADFVTLEGFTVRKSGLYQRDAGIYIRANFAQVNNVIITDNTEGIYIWESTQAVITLCTINDCTYGMHLLTSNDNSIEKNKITDNQQGILLEESSNNNFHTNILTENNDGIMLKSFCAGNTIVFNELSDNSNRGLALDHVVDNINYIDHNNFINNFIHAEIETTLITKWEENYWDDWIGLRYPGYKYFPKAVLGKLLSFIPWVNLDWHPASEPYNIVI